MDTASKKYPELYDEIDGVYEYKKDLLCLPCMPVPLMNDFMDFKMRSEDICIVSYPQSGFIWLQEVLYHLHNQDTLHIPIKKKQPLAFRVPFMEHEFRNCNPMDLLKVYPTPRLMKSHLSRHFLENQISAAGKTPPRIILWSLDPKDVVSNYHHFWNTKGYVFEFPVLEWDQYFEMFLKKQLFEGDWFDMHESWIPHLNDDNLIWLTYEEAKKDPIKTVLKIAKHVGVEVDEKNAELISKMEPFDDFPHFSKKYSKEQIEIVDKLCKQRLLDTPLAKIYSK